MRGCAAVVEHGQGVNGAPCLKTEKTKGGTSKMTVEYLEQGYDIIFRPVPRRGMMLLLPGQGNDGYGERITTDKCIRFNGEKKLYRVYCTQYSNAGSCWVIRHGKKLFIR